jgi:hypothetical protein
VETNTDPRPAHTPGPWQLPDNLEDCWIGKRIEIDPPGEHCDTVDGCVAILPFDDITSLSKESIMANARLIAAAPDLLQPELYEAFRAAPKSAMPTPVDLAMHAYCAAYEAATGEGGAG